MSGQKQYGSIFDKLTDSSKYTGTHKHRFDENGNGRGLTGRDRVGKGSGFIAGGGTADLSQFTRTNLHTSGAGYAHAATRASINSFDAPYIPARATTPCRISPPTPPPALYQHSGTDGAPGRDIYNFPPSGPRNSAGPTASYRPSSVGRPSSVSRSSDSGIPRSTGQRHGSIFDKLTDASLYTGAHKQRFDGAGYGRGKEGRTSANAYVTPYDLTSRR